MLGLKSVLAIWTNIIRSNYINNYAYNSMATHEIINGRFFSTRRAREAGSIYSRVDYQAELLL